MLFIDDTKVEQNLYES